MSLKRRIPFVSLKRRIRESFLKTSLVSPRTSISLDTPLASLIYSFFLHFLPSFFPIYYSFSPITPIYYSFSHLLFLFPYHSHLLFLFSVTIPFPLSLPISSNLKLFVRIAHPPRQTLFFSNFPVLFYSKTQCNNTNLTLYQDKMLKVHNR